MRKPLSIIAAFVIAFCLGANAEITTYRYYDDNQKPMASASFQLFKGEREQFARWYNSGWTATRCWFHVNIDRAHDNLIKAPATIISPVEVSDDKPNTPVSTTFCSQNLAFQLINTTTKTIKSITIKVGLYSYNTPVTDSITGADHCIFTFTNLAGRTASRRHEDYATDILRCCHLLTAKEATSISRYEGYGVNRCEIQDVSVTYDDGTTNDDAAVLDFRCSTTSTFLENSPFNPLIQCYEYLVYNFQENIFGMRTSDELKLRITGNDDIPEITNAEQAKCALEVILSSRNDTVTANKYRDAIMCSIAHMPAFPGGDAALIKFINDHLQYPPGCENIQGKVIVQFVVTATGDIGEVKVVRSIEPDLDREAVRVVKLLPRFQTPGRDAYGKPKDTWYTLPISFKLSPLYVYLNGLTGGWEQVRSKLKQAIKGNNPPGTRYYPL